jgi:2-polyprenyl-3-methyl-5-hydroxy-6-metoxy-1,4-benzoquinol methylase
MNTSQAPTTSPASVAADIPNELPSPAVVFDTLFAYQRTAALRSAIELDVFRAIGEGAGTVPAIAGRCRASERGIRILCDYLVVAGLLRKTGDRYAHTPASAMFLDPRSPASLASTARFLGNRSIIEPFDHLTDIVRSGRTALSGEGTVEDENPVWVEFAHSMAPMMAPMAGPLGVIALDGHRGPMTVLDIAAGHGLFGIEVARQNPEAKVVALDWAPVLDVASANAARAGVADRYDTLPGSAFDVDFGGPYDLILLTNFLHHFDRGTCVTLLRKVRGALTPRGRAATLEFVPAEDRVAPPMAAAFALTMLATTVAGDAYTFSELEGMHREAGFARVTAHPIPHAPHTIVTGDVD